MSEYCVCPLIYLPDEITVQILKRLPAKSLLRFMSVCKTWYSLIKNPSFISSHSDHHMNKEPTYLLYCDSLQSDTYYVYQDTNIFDQHLEFTYPMNKEPTYLLYCDSLRSDTYYVYQDTNIFDQHLEFTYPRKLYKLGCCNGIVCFRDSSITEHLVLWNSSLRKSLDIETPFSVTDGSWVTGWFGFDTTANDYKVVLAYNSTCWSSERTTLLSVYVYSLNDRSWRHVDSTFVLSDEYSISSRGVHLNGVIHWVANRCYEFCYMPALILTFSLRDETFIVLQLPTEIVYRQEPEDFFLIIEDKVYLMIVTRGCKRCLGLVHDDSTNKNLWVMEMEGIVESWRKEFHVRCLDGIKKILNFRMNGEIVVQLNTGGVATFDHRRNSIEHVSSEDMYYVGTYVENLFLL